MGKTRELGKLGDVSGTPSASTYLRGDYSWATVSGGVSDGDKGDITVSASGATWTIDAAAITYAKIQNVAANSFLANATGSAATVQEIATSRIPLFSSAITGTPSATTYLRGDGSWATPSGSSYTFSNGITELTGAVKLGGSLTEDTSIAAGAFRISITSATLSSNQLLTLSNTSSGGAASFNATSGTTLSLTAGNGTAIISAATGGYGIQATSNSIAGVFQSAVASTNNLNTPILLQASTSGTAQADFGVGLPFKLEDAAGSIANAGSIDYTWITATGGSTSARLRISVARAGLTDFIDFNGSTRLVGFSAYGTGARTGTATYYLAVTSTGDIIEVESPGGSPGTVTVASTATLTPDMAAGMLFIITAQAAALSIANPTGTPLQGRKIMMRIKDNGTARAITWSGSEYRASTDLALPTTTVLGKTMYLGFIYNSTDAKWDLIALLNNF